jgi:hypothetical protein
MTPLEERTVRWIYRKAFCGQIALTIDPALKESDASIASGDVVRMLSAFKELQGITG